MLTAKVLNSQALLNNFKVLGSLDFMLGDAFTFAFRIIDPQLGDRYVPPATAIVKVTFNNMDTTTFQKTAAFIDALDQSMLKIDLSAADTAQLLGGNLKFTVDLLGDGTQILNGLMFNVLRKVITDCSC